MSEPAVALAITSVVCALASIFCSMKAIRLARAIRDDRPNGRDLSPDLTPEQLRLIATLRKRRTP